MPPRKCSYGGCRKKAKEDNLFYGVQLCAEHAEMYTDLIFLPCRTRKDYEKIAEITLRFLATAGSRRASKYLDTIADGHVDLVIKELWPRGPRYVPWKEWRPKSQVIPAWILDIIKTKFGISNPYGEDEPEEDEDEFAAEFEEAVSPVEVDGDEELAGDIDIDELIDDFDI
jgi:hypothetical protein